MFFACILVVFGCIFGGVWEKSNCLDYSAPTLRIHFQLIELDFDPILKPVLRSFAYFNVSCQCCLCLTNMLCFFTRLLFSLLSFALLISTKLRVSVFFIFSSGHHLPCPPESCPPIEELWSECLDCGNY